MDDIFCRAENLQPERRAKKKETKEKEPIPDPPKSGCRKYYNERIK